MRMQREQFDSHQWLVNYEPLVVYGNGKKRDGPIIYHRRAAPAESTGPPSVPGFQSDTGPPDTG